jgi:heat shock protein HslJ
MAIQRTLALFTFAVLLLSAFSAVVSKSVTFNGVYRSNIVPNSNVDITLKSDGKVSILGGCNSQSSTYKAYKDNSISFSPFVSTKKFCQNDQDYLYTNVLKNAKFYSASGNRITLKDKNSKTIAILTLIKKLPTVPTSVNLFFNGKYTSNLD